MEKRIPRSARGYILLEVMMGGAMTALLCAHLLSSLSDARVRNVLAARDGVAAALVQDKIEEARSRGFGNAGTICSGAFVVVPNQQAAYRRSCTIGAAQSQTLNGVAVQFEPVDVVVEYDTTNGTRNAKASTRMYQ